MGSSSLDHGYLFTSVLSGSVVYNPMASIMTLRNLSMGAKFNEGEELGV